MNKSVKVIGFKKRFRKADNEPFYVFELFGGPVAHVSKTGKISIATPVITIPANTMNEDHLRVSIGCEMEGQIKSFDCAPTEFTAKDGSTQIRTHEWKFVPAGTETPVSVPESIEAVAVEDDLPA